MSVVCHCKDCQRQSGSAFSTIVGLSESEVEISGETGSFSKQSDAGKSVERVFCPSCGSPMFTRVESAPGMIFVKASTLDEARDYAPQMHIWASGKQHWVDIGEVPAVDKNPG